jgi:hypothetical protein
VLYQPRYLQDVVDYYARPELKTGPLEENVPPDRRRIYVVASFLEQGVNRDAVRAGRRELEKNYELVRTERRPQIRVLVYERKEDRR